MEIWHRRGRSLRNGRLISRWLGGILLISLVAATACSTAEPEAGEKPSSDGTSTDDSGDPTFIGTGTVTLSKPTVANQCSAPVEATLTIDVNGVGHLTLDYRNPISDQVVAGEELRFVCVDDGEPQTRDYRAEGVGGTFIFEAEFLVSGGFDAVVDGDGASLAGQLEGGSNVWDFVFDRLQPGD